MRRIVLVNPNTDRRATDAMIAVALAEAGGAAAVLGVTAAAGVSLITDEDALQAAAGLLPGMVPEIAGHHPDAVIVAAFGDPALGELRELLPVPVTGICEAAMAEAARLGPRFGVVTTTPGLVAAIARAAAAYGCGDAFAGTWTTRRDARQIGGDPAALVDALFETCVCAASEGRLAAVVIGGGPLATAARTLSGRLPVPIVEPVPAAIRMSLARIVQAAATG